MFLPVPDALFVHRYAPLLMRLLGTNLRGALRRFRERLISCGVSLVSAIAPERALW